MRKKILLGVLVFLVLGGLTFAQAKVSLTIQCNQSGAQIYLNDNLVGYTAPNFSLSIFPGTYTIRVVKDGFPEFRTKVVAAQSPITIVANLGGATPQTPQAPAPGPIQPMPPTPSSPPLKPPTPPSPVWQLSIDANINGARVYINGSYAGTTPFAISLRPGTYSIGVSLGGYEDYTTTLRLNGPYHIYARLSPLQLPVYIDAVNTPGANIYRDSAYIGTTPYRGTWPRGTYVVRITAPGYADYVERVFVDGSTNLQVSLSPLPVEYEIKLPDNFSNSWEKPGKFNEMELFIDGVRLNRLRGTIMPGAHTLTMTYRDLRFENEFTVGPGKPATIELFLGVRVY
jgi:hypothetical protein